MRVLPWEAILPLLQAKIRFFLVTVTAIPKIVCGAITDTFNLDIFEHLRHSQYQVQHHQQSR
jgi:hypothetical protein